MRASIPDSQSRNSSSAGDASTGVPEVIDGNTRVADLLCPLQTAIRNELHELGLGVSEVHRYLHCGDLKNAEQALGDIFVRLQENFCPSDLNQCEWVREPSPGKLCDLLQSRENPYALSLTTQTHGAVDACDQTTSRDGSGNASSFFDQMLKQAMQS